MDVPGDVVAASASPAFLTLPLTGHKRVFAVGRYRVIGMKIRDLENRKRRTTGPPLGRGVQAKQMV
jgi:hypothetical protein